MRALPPRLGSHSTSDDQSRYQDMSEVTAWQEGYFPLDRLRGYLQARKLWDEDREGELVSRLNTDIRAALQR